VSIQPILCEPKSGLNRSGLEGKLPVIRGDEKGDENVPGGTVLAIPDVACMRDSIIALREQNVSSARECCTALPESGLCKASTSSTLRLQPKDGLVSSKIAKYQKISGSVKGACQMIKA
jgi:hypothetical protein